MVKRARQNTLSKPATWIYEILSAPAPTALAPIWRGVTQCKTRAGKTICQQAAYLPTGRDAGKLMGLINTSMMTDDKPWHATFPGPGNKLHSTCLNRKPLTRQRSQCRMQGKEREDHSPNDFRTLSVSPRVNRPNPKSMSWRSTSQYLHKSSWLHSGMYWLVLGGVNQPWMMDEYVEWVDHMFIRCVKEPLKTCPKVVKSNEVQVLKYIFASCILFFSPMFIHTPLHLYVCLLNIHWRKKFF